MDINSFFDKTLDLKGKNIAIVGSSISILDNEYGELIDSHDHIIRFNLAPINEYKQHVGLREDFRAINDGQYHHFKNTNDIHNSKIIFNNPRNINYGSGRDRYLHSSSKVFILNPKMVEIFRKNCGFKSSKISSTGISIIMLFITCGFIPSIFGFDYEFKPYQHYWEKEAISSGTATDICYEKSLLKQFIETNKIKAY